MAKFPLYPDYKLVTEQQFDPLTATIRQFKRAVRDGDYCEIYDKLRLEGFKLISSVITKTLQTHTFSYLYQFRKNDEYRYVIEDHIYGGGAQFMTSDEADRVYGIFEGIIEDELKKIDKSQFLGMKTENKKLSNNEFNSNFRDKFNYLKKLKIPELKAECLQLGLKKSGSKDDLIEKIIYKLFKINELWEG